MSKQNETPDNAAELEALKAKLAEAEKAVEDEKAKTAEAEKAKEAAEAKAEASTKASKPAAKVKTRDVRVISATRYSYLLDDENQTRVTPDLPVKAELREGNLLHSHMEAGLIKEFA